MIKLLLFDFFGVILFGGNISNMIFNQELLQFVKVQKNNYKTAILTNSDKLMSNKLVSAKLQPYFDQIFLAKDLEWSKQDPEIYKYIAAQFKIEPQKIFFVDDQEWNIEAAKKAGCETHLFTNNQELLAKLKTNIPNLKFIT